MGEAGYRITKKDYNVYYSLLIECISWVVWRKKRRDLSVFLSIKWGGQIENLLGPLHALKLYESKPPTRWYTLQFTPISPFSDHPEASTNCIPFLHLRTKVWPWMIMSWILKIQFKALMAGTAFHVAIYYRPYPKITQEWYPRNTLGSGIKWKSLSCGQLCDPMNSTVHGIL